MYNTATVINPGEENAVATRKTSDRLGNIVSVTGGEGNAANYEYDNLNRPAKITDALGK